MRHPVQVSEIISAINLSFPSNYLYVPIHLGGSNFCGHEYEPKHYRRKGKRELINANSSKTRKGKNAVLKFTTDQRDRNPQKENFFVGAF